MAWEIGKWYRTRGGHSVVKIIAFCPQVTDQFPYAGLLVSPEQDEDPMEVNFETWQLNGRYRERDSSALDLTTLSAPDPLA